MRVALGGLSTGSSWHVHGPALLAVVAGQKSWFIRNPRRTLPKWLAATWKATASQSTQVRPLHADKNTALGCDRFIGAPLPDRFLLEVAEPVPMLAIAPVRVCSGALS